MSAYDPIIITLAEMKIGQQGEVLDPESPRQPLSLEKNLGSEGEILRELGILGGERIQVVARGFGGDPVAVELEGGPRVAVGRQAASSVRLRLLSDRAGSEKHE